MGFWNKIFGKKDEQKVGGMEDFMTLIRVYFQAALAADLGITNLAALPDLRVFKSTLKVPTVNNKLGVGERGRCKNMLKSMYQMDDAFFKEIDLCRDRLGVLLYLGYQAGVRVVDRAGKLVSRALQLVDVTVSVRQSSAII